MKNESEELTKHPWDLWIKDFLQQWFTGLMKGIRSVDEETRKKVLEFTGRNCAKSHALELFNKAKNQGENLEQIVKILNESFGQDIYKIIADNQIKVTYPKCYCPLVDLGLIDSPMLCNCSCNWLLENFEVIFGKNNIEIFRKDSVLSGDEHCDFIVKFE